PQLAEPRVGVVAARRDGRSVRPSRILAAAVVVAVFVAWHSSGRRWPVAVLPSAMLRAAAGDRLIVEPDDGRAPIYSLLSSPRRTLDLTMYELDDPTVEQILASDAARGVRVRVILDRRLEQQRNEAAYDYLTNRHVQVTWSSSRFFATHQK